MPFSLPLRRSILTALTLAAAGWGCGGGGKMQQGTRPITMLVGSAGAVLSTPDGEFTLEIPEGALVDDTIIAVQPTGSPGAGALGTVYEIGPSGLQFAFPVKLTLGYDAAALTGSDKSLLRVATFAGAAWQILPGAVVDTRAKTVSAVTTHLSPYSIVWQATGKSCAPVQATIGCTGGGTDPDAGTLMACGTPTCSSASSACASYPGTTMDSCLDGQNGYSASCCFPSGAPLCFAATAASGTCATATGACDGYPGATLQSCVDGASGGYSGACCFAADAPACVAVKAALGCTPGTGGCATTPPRCADGDPCAGYAGATAQSCTDTTDGFQASCCFAVGTLPIKAAP
ncbi:MAG TPA: hypothetical protein VIF57_06750 [Polyangia bacterium]|jgi:hypothetical protein